MELDIVPERLRSVVDFYSEGLIIPDGKNQRHSASYWLSTTVQFIRLKDTFRGFEERRITLDAAA